MTKRIRLDIPEHLYAALLQEAQESGKSINDLIVEVTERLCASPVETPPGPDHP